MNFRSNTDNLSSIANFTSENINYMRETMN